MADPIRQALERLLAVIKPKYTDPDEIVAVVRAMAAARAALAAEPPAPDPCEALAARPLLEAVARLGDCIGQHTVGEIATISDRAAAWLAENPPGQPVAIEPRGCPTPGACSCVEPTGAGAVADHIPDVRNMVLATDYAARLRQCPTHGQLPANAWGCLECLRELREELARLRGSAADGEREELASALEVTGSYEIPSYEQLRRAAALLREARPQPVAGWQPIDTAPHDGTEILASDYDAIEILTWSWDAWETGSGWIDRNGQRLFPACWQPLPDHPPQGGEVEQ